MEKVKLIQGNQDRADEIRKTFKEWGGKNLLSHTFCHDEFYYYVDPLGIIRFINYMEFESIDKNLVEIYELPKDNKNSAENIWYSLADYLEDLSKSMKKTYLNKIRHYCPILKQELDETVKDLYENMHLILKDEELKDGDIINHEYDDKPLVKKTKFIKGSAEKSEQILKTLKEWGGWNKNNLNCGNEFNYYYVDSFGDINFMYYPEGDVYIADGKAELFELLDLD